MNKAEKDKSNFELRYDLDLLTQRFQQASGKTERRKLLASMMFIVEELRKLYHNQNFIHVL